MKGLREFAIAATSFLSLAMPCMAVAETAAVPAGYRAAAAEVRMGSVLFYAMALVESGQSQMTADYRPWPWTLSIDGQPNFYPTREDARAALDDAVRRQVSQLGVGLFQIEYRFHAHRFPSPESILDPYVNARAAAEIFAEGLDRVDGDVWEAVGLFHSATPDLASAYRARVARRLFDLVGRQGHED